jgi:hypothetical protein
VMTSPPSPVNTRAGKHKRLPSPRAGAAQARQALAQATYAQASKQAREGPPIINRTPLFSNFSNSVLPKAKLTGISASPSRNRLLGKAERAPVRLLLW